MKIHTDTFVRNSDNSDTFHVSARSDFFADTGFLIQTLLQKCVRVHKNLATLFITMSAE
jgi:hypothetical protein